MIGWLSGLFKPKPRCPERWNRGGVYHRDIWVCRLPAGHDDDHYWAPARKGQDR